MNRRLELIDRIKEVIHAERRLHGHHGRAVDCPSCREQATFVVDELAPILVAAQAVTA